MAHRLTRRSFAAAAAVTATGLGRAARADERVTLYTAHEASIVEQLIPLFQKETGITADVVKAGSGDVINRVKAEAAAPKADVIWSIGGEVLASNAGLLEAYKPAGFDTTLDPKFAADGNWLPYTGVIMVLAVNTKKLKPADYPTSWADLADKKWKGQISSARADSSGSAFTQYTTILSAFGDKGKEMYTRIFANFALSDSSGAVPRFVNDGEALVGITLEDNALQYVKGGGNVAIVYPSEGTTINADGLALVKRAPHPAQAKRFIDWAVGPSAQQILVQSIGRRSIRRDVPGNAVLPPLPNIKTIPYDMAAISRDRARLIADWKKIADS